MIASLPKTVFLLPPIAVAESTYEGVKSSSLGEFLVQGAAALVLLMLVWSFIERLRGTAQKREVSFADSFATKEEHDALKSEVTKIDNERRVSTAKLHEKIDEVMQVSSSTSGQLTQINQQLQQINVHLINRGK